MSDFFKKDEDYSIPSTSNYMKFEEGDNRFRILGSFADGTAIRGVVYWKTVNGKRGPVRLKPGIAVPVNELEFNPKTGEVDQAKYFWALPVYNYQEKRIQILDVTQKTILNYIKKQVENPKWGDPRDYDFIVTRTLEKGKTTYTVTNDPKEEIDKKIVQECKDMNINIAALYDGKDPFNSEPKIDNDEVDAGIEAQRGAGPRG
jgi:hypothetical protein